MRERLQLLSLAFYCCAKAHSASLDAHEAEGGRVEGAPAHLDQQHMERCDPPFPPTVHQLVEVHSYCYLSAAGEYMRGLGALYDKEEVLVAPPALVRCVLEHSARVVWLLDYDQQPEDRAARTYLDLLMCTVERKKTSGRFSGKGSKQHRGNGRLLAHIRKEAETLFGEPVVDDKGEHRIRGQRIPGLEDCVAALLDQLPGNSALDPRGLYDRMSNLAHPMVYSQVETMARTVEDGKVAFRLAVTPEDHQQLAALAVDAFFAALGRVISYQGWDCAPYDQWTKSALELLWAQRRSD
ncbi:MAG: hypothetical protein ACRDJX_03085 [Solirubrobacteraceae bacterium]